MTDDYTTSSALALLQKSSATGGGPKSSMPVEDWAEAIKADGVVAVPTFHGTKGEQIGYRSGEIHDQLKKHWNKYFYVYRNIEGSEQPYLFLAFRKKVFTDAGIPVTLINEYSEE